MENRIPVLKPPFNILQLGSDKRAHFSSPGLLWFSNTNRKKQKNLETWWSVNCFGVFCFVLFVQILLSQFPLPPCQTRLSRQRCPLTASRWLCQTTAAKRRATWASLTASSPTTRSISALAPRLVRPLTPPFPRALRMVPRKWVFRSPPVKTLPMLSQHPLHPTSSFSFAFLSSPLSDLSHQTIGYSPDPMEPAVGSTFPGFIWTCQNSGQCVIMPLSHQHNKVLYFSPTIAKALSLSSFSF